jgi:hypothetical protein
MAATIELLRLLTKFNDLADRETEDAYFRTHVPTVGSSAYLNIVYKAPPRSILEEVDRDLHFPESLKRFYADWNGARLFVGALSVYGCLSNGRSFDRTDPFRLPPFDVREINREFAKQTKSAGLICIGSYSYDRSIVCIHRETQSVFCCVGKDFSKRRQEWADLDQWLTEETGRLSFLFDSTGTRLVDKELLLPGLERSRAI